MMMAESDEHWIPVETNSKKDKETNSKKLKETNAKRTKETNAKAQALPMFSSLPKLSLPQKEGTIGNVVFVSAERATVWFSPFFAQEKLEEVSQVIC